MVSQKRLDQPGNTLVIMSGSNEVLLVVAQI